MATTEATITRPVGGGLAADTKPRPRPLGAELVHSPARPAARDDDGGIFGLAIGSGIVFIQACAIAPGLLPCMLLLLPFVLPVVVLGAVGAILVGVSLGLWRLARAALRVMWHGRG
jgi:hypothetical protein